ncbi:prolyl endopeptidase-like [Dermatophagoides pteronyssinus]|uniref:prolyl endopeptidase-like n=1 Tax=Dermatophagoides pteronyssinus TaxID=6956 RepID=UPI003F6694AB
MIKSFNGVCNRLGNFVSKFQNQSRLLSFRIQTQTKTMSTERGPFVYPDVNRLSNVEDEYFGQKISDPYRWLEKADSDETARFVEEQNRISSKYIQSCQYRDRIIERLTDLFEYPRYGCPYRRGDNYFMEMNTGLQNQSVLYIMRGSSDAKPEIFFDPNSLSEDGTVSLSPYICAFSDDGKWWSYGLQKSGSDWSSIRIRNVDTGKDLDEELIKVKFSNISWTKDNKGFFYSYFPDRNDQCDGQETTECTFQKLYYHRLNQPQSSDILIYETPDHPRYRFKTCVSDCGNYLHLFINHSCEYNLWYYHQFSDPKNPKIDGRLEFEPIITEYESDYHYITNDGPIHYIHTNHHAPKFHVIKIDLSNESTRLESNWIDLIKEHSKDVLDSIQVVRNNILVCHYLSDVVSRIELRKLSDGSLIKNISIPVGTVSAITAKRKHDELFFLFTSFLVPSSSYHLKFTATTDDNGDISQDEPKCFRESVPKNFDPTKFVTKQIFYESKDGTRVPMFIVHKNGLEMNGNHPCLLYGYGGFNIPVQPYFSVARLIPLDNMNCVFALANIRGGGEYGEQWHDDGKLLLKQNCFNDFIAAAEYLVKEKYTSPKRIIIQGGSNGGLLVAAVSNQRPDLFGCTICHVGVLDMLRYHKFTIGHAWISEYGSPDDNDNGEKHYRNLISYSPLHTIPTMVDHYPATLLLTADHDDRVVPLHSFKFISELQYRLGKRLPSIPLMIRIDTKAGHGFGKPTTKIIEEVADIYSFILNSLSLDYVD